MIEFFKEFLDKVKATTQWNGMELTVENSPWHREANVAVHTEMCINSYMSRFHNCRTDRQRIITLMALVFHDVGKPDAEETLEKKDQPGVFYRRYAGHEPISANEFMSFMCDNTELRELFFVQGFDWADVRKIKFMIENHLPYGLKNPVKRERLREAVAMTMGDDEQCFFDMLRSDAAGRISDDHEQKLQNVEDWINEFQPLPFKPTVFADRKNSGVKPFTVSLTDKKVEFDFTTDTAQQLMKDRQPTMYLLVGISGAGKSTFIRDWMPGVKVVSEDEYRLTYYKSQHSAFEYAGLSAVELYDTAWQYCHLHKDSKYEAFAKEQYANVLKSGESFVLDRMNQGRKARGKWIEPAKQEGYRIESVEFFISERELNNRQTARKDKFLPPFRVHQLFMTLETPWVGPEVDAFTIVPPTPVMQVFCFVGT